MPGQDQEEYRDNPELELELPVHISEAMECSNPVLLELGHDSERAGLIYLHSSRKRQRVLADAVGKAAQAELPRVQEGQHG